MKCPKCETDLTEEISNNRGKALLGNQFSCPSCNAPLEVDPLSLVLKTFAFLLFFTGLAGVTDSLPIADMPMILAVVLTAAGIAAYVGSLKRSEYARPRKEKTKG